MGITHARDAKVQPPTSSVSMTMRNLDLTADDRELMEIWHEQTRNHPGAMGRRARIIETYLTDPQLIRKAAKGWPRMAGDKIIPMPPPGKPSARLADACAVRRSTSRPEIKGRLPLQVLSDLLGLSIRSNRRHSSAIASDATFAFRPYPSAGGLFPCEIFVISGAIDGLPSQPLRYDARDHVLVDFGCPRGRFQAIETIPDLDAPPCALVIVGVLDRVTSKYGSRGYRFACLEAGHVSQNVLLAASALGLTSLTYGSYYDAELEKWLDLDGLNEVVLSVILLGCPDDGSPPSPLHESPE
jgi:SagB-type dehydrogenase family enzyme